MINKFFLGLIALSLSFSACQNGKNSVTSNKSTNKNETVVSISSDADLYHDNTKTNALLFENSWILVAYVDPEGQETSYSGLKIYNFRETRVEFTDDFPNDCNSCSVSVKYDLKQQSISLEKENFRSCTKLKCKSSAATLEDEDLTKLDDGLKLVLEENMSYKILKNNTLELQTSLGRYLFRINIDLRTQNLEDLNNTVWEIIAYREVKNTPSETFTPLRKSLIISFNGTGYGYSPDCNSCGYTLKNFSSKNGTISWDNKIDAINNGICTQMACLNEKTELPHSIVSNGMTYKVVDKHLHLSDDNYKLKLRPFKLK